MLTTIQRAELEHLGAASIRFKLTQHGSGRGASISGFKCGDITRGEHRRLARGKKCGRDSPAIGDLALGQDRWMGVARVEATPPGLFLGTPLVAGQSMLPFASRTLASVARNVKEDVLHHALLSLGYLPASQSYPQAHPRRRASSTQASEKR
jgi:hypothetical protein